MRRAGTWGRARLWIALVSLVCWAGEADAFRAIPCAADCDGNGTVAINEMIVCVNIAAGSVDPETCPACDPNDDARVTIDELIVGVSSLLGICHFDDFDCCGDGIVQPGEACDDGNVVGGDGCSDECLHETGSCPLQSGAYTLTHTAGGIMQISTLSPFPLPAGTLILDVAPATAPACRHRAVVPFPDGFEIPTFCVPAAGFSVAVTQAGCGVAEIDSNGGADYTIRAVGDTSDASPICGAPQACDVDVDDALRVDLTVGDGAPDACEGGGANLVATVPVRVVIWLEQSIPASCPSDDGFDPDEGDTLVLELTSVLDFTTDVATALFEDLDGDGCASPHFDPNLSGMGACLDLDNRTVRLTAATPVTAGPPLFDTPLHMLVPLTGSGPAPPLQASCDAAPPIVLDGTVSRCSE